jgi:hypothetical protein
MAKIYTPDVVPVPEGATKEDRLRMYEEYRKELFRLNPHLCNPDGSRRTIFQYFITKWRNV